MCRKQGNYDRAISIYTALLKNPIYDAHALLYRRAICYQKTHRYTEALSDYTQLLGTQKSTDAWVGMAEIYQETKQLPLAIAFLGAALHQEADPYLHFLRAEALEQNGQLKEAIETLEKALELEPYDSGLHEYKAQIHLKRREWEAAIASLIQARKLRSDGIKNDLYPELIRKKHRKVNPAPAYFFRGRVAKGAGLLEWALSDFNQVIQHQKDWIDAYWFRGCIHNKLGNYKAAIKDLTHFLKRCPGYALVYLERSVAFYHLKKLELSLSDCETALKINPHLQNALKGQIHHLIELKNYTKALEVIQKRIDTSPGNLDYYDIKANILFRIPDYDALLQTCQDMENLKYYRTHLWQGIVYAELGNWEKALKFFDIAEYHLERQGKERDEENLAGICLNKATALFHLRALDQALYYLEEAYDISENCYLQSQVCCVLSLVYELKGQLDMANFCCELSLGLNKDNQFAWKQMGQLSAKQTRYKEAIVGYKKWLAVYPNSPDVLQDIGMAYFNMGKYKKFRTWIKKSLKLNTGHWFKSLVSKPIIEGQVNSSEQTLKQAQNLLTCKIKQVVLSDWEPCQN